MLCYVMFWNTNMAAVMWIRSIGSYSASIFKGLVHVFSTYIIFFTSNTIIKMIHIHSFDPEGAKIYQSLYLLYFHLLNSHWPLAFAFLMFILTSLRTISSLFFFNCLAYCHGCLELLLLIVGGEHFRRKTLDQGEGHERSSKPCVWKWPVYWWTHKASSHSFR